MYKVAHAIGGNHRTMSRFFKKRPSLIKQYNAVNEDEDAVELGQLVDRIEEERVLNGEFAYNNEFDIDILDVINESNAVENLEDTGDIIDMQVDDNSILV
jgi:hypothetical protein